MNKETADLIRELADRLGVASGELIELFVPRVVSGAVFQIAAGIFVMAAGGFLLRLALWVEADDRPFALVGAGVVAALLWIATLTALYEAVVTLASPRAAAIVEVLELVR